MKFFLPLPLLSGFLLTACSTQSPNQANAYLQEANPTPVTRPCEKIDALINEYANNFEKIKLNNKDTRIGQVWQAKYHLVGNTCKVWGVGKDNTTYSCSVTAPTQEIAKGYFDKAQKTTQGCLDDTWKMKKQHRKDDKGLKVEFTTTQSDLTIASHMVPTSGLFKSEWTVYYYVGSTSNQHKKSQ